MDNIALLSAALQRFADAKPAMTLPKLREWLGSAVDGVAAVVRALDEAPATTAAWPVGIKQTALLGAVCAVAVHVCILAQLPTEGVPGDDAAASGGSGSSGALDRRYAATKVAMPRGVDIDAQQLLAAAAATGSSASELPLRARLMVDVVRALGPLLAHRLCDAKLRAKFLPAVLLGCFQLHLWRVAGVVPAADDDGAAAAAAAPASPPLAAFSGRDYAVQLLAPLRPAAAASALLQITWHQVLADCAAVTPATRVASKVGGGAVETPPQLRLQATVLMTQLVCGRLPAPVAAGAAAASSGAGSSSPTASASASADHTPSGVEGVFDAVCDAIDMSNAAAAERACMMTATIVARPPLEVMTAADYCAAVAPQLIKLLRVGGFRSAWVTQTAAVTLLRIIMEPAYGAPAAAAADVGSASHPRSPLATTAASLAAAPSGSRPLYECFIIQPLFAPLRAFTQRPPAAGGTTGAGAKDDAVGESVIADENAVVGCVEDLHKLLASPHSPPLPPRVALSMCVAALPALVALATAAATNKLRASFATACREVIAKLLAPFPPPMTLYLLLSAASGAGVDMRDAAADVGRRIVAWRTAGAVGASGGVSSSSTRAPRPSAVLPAIPGPVTGMSFRLGDSAGYRLVHRAPRPAAAGATGDAADLPALIMPAASGAGSRGARGTASGSLPRRLRPSALSDLFSITGGASASSASGPGLGVSVGADVGAEHHPSAPAVHSSSLAPAVSSGLSDGVASADASDDAARRSASFANLCVDILLLLRRPASTSDTRDAPGPAAGTAHDPSAAFMTATTAPVAAFLYMFDRYARDRVAAIRSARRAAVGAAVDGTASDSADTSTIAETVARTQLLIALGERLGPALLRSSLQALQCVRSVLHMLVAALGLRVPPAPEVGLVAPSARPGAADASASSVMATARRIHDSAHAAIAGADGMDSASAPLAGAGSAPLIAEVDGTTNASSVPATGSARRLMIEEVGIAAAAAEATAQLSPASDAAASADLSWMSEEDKQDTEDTLSMCISLLMAACVGQLEGVAMGLFDDDAGGEALGKADAVAQPSNPATRAWVHSCLPLLAACEAFPEPTISEMASSVRAAILTTALTAPTPVTSDGSSAASAATAGGTSAALRRHVEAAASSSGTTADDRSFGAVLAPTAASIAADPVPLLKQGMQLLLDPAPALQAHGLRCIARVVRANPPSLQVAAPTTTPAPASQLHPLLDNAFQLGVKHAAHSDAFVVTAACDMLQALVVTHPRACLPRLLRLYAAADGGAGATADGTGGATATAAVAAALPIRSRVKVGEALAAAVRSAGDVGFLRVMAAAIASTCMHVAMGVGWRLQRDVVDLLLAMLDSTEESPARGTLRASSAAVSAPVDADGNAVEGSGAMYNAALQLIDISDWRVSALAIVGDMAAHMGATVSLLPEISDIVTGLAGVLQHELGTQADALAAAAEHAADASAGTAVAASASAAGAASALIAVVGDDGDGDPGSRRPVRSASKAVTPAPAHDANADKEAAHDVKRLLQSTAATVRRAAAYGCCCIVAGVCKHITGAERRADGSGDATVPAYLPPVQRAMKHCAEADTDAAVRKHAAIAAGHIDDLLQHILRSEKQRGPTVHGFIGLPGAAGAAGASRVRMVSLG